jgi:hypothetical protein
MRYIDFLEAVGDELTWWADLCFLHALADHIIGCGQPLDPMPAVESQRFWTAWEWPTDEAAQHLADWRYELDRESIA